MVSDTHVFAASVVNSFTFGHQTDLQHAGEEEKGAKPLTGDTIVKAIGLQGVNSGGYSTEEIEEQMHVFADEVMPVLRRECGGGPTLPDSTVQFVPERVPAF